MDAQIFNHSEWIKEVDQYKLQDFFDKALDQAEFMVCGYQEKIFKPHGYTGLWLLAESHFAVHTFPEQNKTYIELSSCSFKKHVDFMNYIQNAKKAEVIK